MKNMLTKREIEVLNLLAVGNSFNSIAETLKISDQTVTSHTKNLKRKLDAKNLCHLITKAILSGYLNKEKLN